MGNSTSSILDPFGIFSGISNTLLAPFRLSALSVSLSLSCICLVLILFLFTAFIPRK